MDTSAPSLEVFKVNVGVLNTLIFGMGAKIISEWEKPITVRSDGALHNLVLVNVVLAYGSGAGTRWSLKCLPTQTILWVYDISYLTIF